MSGIRGSKKRFPFSWLTILLLSLYHLPPTNQVRTTGKGTHPHNKRRLCRTQASREKRRVFNKVSTAAAVSEVETCEAPRVILLLCEDTLSHKQPSFLFLLSSTKEYYVLLDSVRYLITPSEPLYFFIPFLWLSREEGGERIIGNLSVQVLLL